MSRATVERERLKAEQVEIEKLIEIQKKKVRQLDGMIMVKAQEIEEVARQMDKRKENLNLL